jgi:hypothetical protein
MVTGTEIAAFGFYNRMPRTSLSGLFWFGVGVIIAGCIVSYSQRSDSETTANEMDDEE